MNKTQIPATVIHLTEDTALLTNQEYRVVAPGLILTVPACEPGEFMIIEAVANQSDVPSKLRPADSVTIAGAGDDVNVPDRGRTVLKCRTQNAWVI